MICFALISIGNAEIKITTANQLIEEMEEYKKADEAKSDNDADFVKATSFASYVIAIYDVNLLYKQTCPAETVTRNQIWNVVIQWIEDNPTRWHEPAAVLVSQALQSSFPCNEK